MPRLSEHAVKDIRATDAAIASARNSYFYEHLAYTFYVPRTAGTANLCVLSFYERSRFAEFVVEMSQIL